MQHATHEIGVPNALKCHQWPIGSLSQGCINAAYGGGRHEYALHDTANSTSCLNNLPCVPLCHFGLIPGFQPFTTVLFRGMSEHPALANISPPIYLNIASPACTYVVCTPVVVFVRPEFNRTHRPPIPDTRRTVQPAQFTRFTSLSGMRTWLYTSYRHTGGACCLEV